MDFTPRYDPRSPSSSTFRARDDSPPSHSRKCVVSPSLSSSVWSVFLLCQCESQRREIFCITIWLEEEEKEDVKTWQQQQQLLSEGG